MGFFSFICPYCRTPINGSESVHFRHIRHGKVLGETEGSYDGYGRVFGVAGADPFYRSCANKLPANMKDYPNTHEEICKSEYDLPDSEGFRGRLYQGKPVSVVEFLELLGYKVGTDEIPEHVHELWRSLPKYERQGRPRSGTSAYHVYCWSRLTERQKNNNIISKRDPGQGCGKEREKYL